MAGTKHPGYDAGLAALVPFDGVFQFNVPAVLGPDETGADQHQNEVSGPKLLRDLRIDGIARQHLSVVPNLDQSGAFQRK